MSWFAVGVIGVVFLLVILIIVLVFLVQGTRGPVGGPGPTGQSGEQGLVGPKGPTGGNGLAGPTGPPGQNSGQIVNITGPTGAAGATGASGFHSNSLNQTLQFRFTTQQDVTASGGFYDVFITDPQGNTSGVTSINPTTPSTTIVVTAAPVLLGTYTFSWRNTAITGSASTAQLISNLIAFRNDSDTSSPFILSPTKPAVGNVQQVLYTVYDTS